MNRLISVTGVWLLVAAVLGLAGCSGDDPTGPPKQKAPPLPSLSTMAIDLSFFDQTVVNSQAAGVGETNPSSAAALASKDNFLNAALRAHAVQLIFWGAVTPAVAAFALAAHSVPQLQSDGFWLWTYIYMEDEREYRIYLYGRDNGDRTEWRMEASSNDPQMPLDHFVWFEGEVVKPTNSGYWQFYSPVSSPPTVAASALGQTPGKPSARMDWRNLPGSVQELGVFNNDPDSPDVGDTLVFYGSPAVDSIAFTDASDLEAIYNITWYADGSGSIQVPDYNDGVKACWNVDQYDIACPE